LTNLTGIKPTYGRVSRYGMIAFASSLDQAACGAHRRRRGLRLAGDGRLRSRDSTSVDRPVDDYAAALGKPIKGLRIGLPKEYFAEGLAPGARTCVMAAVNKFEELGAVVSEISLPNSPLSVPTYYVVAPAEASSNLARFDGVRYGHRAEGAKTLEELYKKSRGEGFGAEVQRRIMIGTYVLSHGYYDAYYLKAQKVRRLIYDDFKRAFANVDVVLGRLRRMLPSSLVPRPMIRWRCISTTSTPSPRTLPAFLQCRSPAASPTSAGGLAADGQLFRRSAAAKCRAPVISRRRIGTQSRHGNLTRPRAVNRSAFVIFDIRNCELWAASQQLCVVTLSRCRPNGGASREQPHARSICSNHLIRQAPSVHG